MFLETVRSALESRGYDVTAAGPGPASASSPAGDRWRPPDLHAEGDDALACWVVDDVSPATVIRAQAAARGLQARPALAGEAVDDGARPWARRYGVELLDPPAAEVGDGEANGAGPDEGAGDDPAGPARPAVGQAPLPAGEETGDGAAASADPTPGEDGPDQDVVGLLDLPSDDESSSGEPDEDEARAPGGPPAWLANRPVPWETGPDAGEGDGSPVPAEDRQESPGPPSVALPGVTPAPDPDPGLEDAPSEPVDPGETGDEPLVPDSEPDDEHLEPEPETGGGPTPPAEHPGTASPTPEPTPSSPGRLPWAPPEEDPPTPGTLDGDEAVDPPGDPLREGARPDDEARSPAPSTNGDGPAPEPDEEPTADEPAGSPGPNGNGGPAEPPKYPGRTSLDALVEAASQSPHPIAEAAGDGDAADPAGADAAGTAANGGEPSPETPAAGSSKPHHRTTSTDPEKIAEDVMREVEAEEADGDGGGSSGGVPTDKTGSELLGDDPEPSPDAHQPAGETGGTPEPEVAGPRPSGGGGARGNGGPEPPWSSGDPDGERARSPAADASPDPGATAGAPDPGSRAEEVPGGAGEEALEGVAPVDDAAMRRHDPALWGTSGRLDDLRTSLRDAGDSPHARARERVVESGWLDDLDGDGA